MTRSLRERALALLARREHARTELRRKLAPHAESAEEVDALLDDLARQRLLSDARYADMRIHVRANRYGNARLAQELRQQGVSDEIVAATLADADDELSRARAVYAKKFAAPPSTPQERAKQMRFLQTRGFSGEIIRQVMRSLPAAHNECSTDDDFL